MSVFVIDSQYAIRKREFPGTLYAVYNISLFDFLSRDHGLRLSKPNFVGNVSILVVNLEDKLMNLNGLSSFVKISKKNSSLLILIIVKS